MESWEVSVGLCWLVQELRSSFAGRSRISSMAGAGRFQSLCTLSAVRAEVSMFSCAGNGCVSALLVGVMLKPCKSSTLSLRLVTCPKVLCEQKSLRVLGLCILRALLSLVRASKRETTICAVVKKTGALLGANRDGHPPGRILNTPHDSCQGNHANGPHIWI